MRPQSVLVVAALLAVGLAGCLASPGETVDASDPLPNETNESVNYTLPDAITGMESVAGIEHDTASGLWIHDGYAFVGGQGAGIYVVDVHDPQNPEKVATVENASARDVDILETGNRTVAVGAGGGSTMSFVDVTDPEDPELLTNFDAGAPVHNLAVVPNTTLVYNSRSLGDPVDAGIDIVDASDPAAPEVVDRWTFPPVAANQPVRSTGCHDITVYPEADRAYCAGVTQTYIMDIADPTAPSISGVVTNPAINIHHFAVPAEGHGHDLLLIGDEAGGALLAACYGYEDTPAGPASTPTGALWFYDISDPAAPVLLGYVSPPMPSEGPVTPRTGNPFNTCTAHFGQQIPGRDLFAMGWYVDGVQLIDFSDPTRPAIVDQAIEDRNVWDVRYTDGHLVTGDIGAGTTVLQLTGS